MGKIKSKFDEIVNRLKVEGKVEKIEWSAEEMDKFNEELKEFRRDFIKKQFESEKSAAKIHVGPPRQ